MMVAKLSATTKNKRVCEYVIYEYNSSFFYSSFNATCMRKYEGRNGNNVSASYYEHFRFYVFENRQNSLAVCTQFYLFRTQDQCKFALL